MTKTTSRPKVAMTAPTLEDYGGICSVLRAWLQSPELDRVELRRFRCTASQQKRFRKARMLKERMRFSWALRRGYRPDLLHINIGGPISWIRESSYALEAHRLYGIPYVAHIHGCSVARESYEQSPILRALIRHILSNATTIVVVTASIIPSVKEWVKTPVQTLYNPVDTSGLPPFEPQLPSATPTVLFMGWMLEAKGIFDLLEAIPLIRQEVPEARFRFAGNGDDIERFRQAVDAKRIPVEILGWVSGTERERAYAEADILCLPSHSEGFPVTVMEAMAIGLPVAATRISGIPEQVIEGETGFLFEPHSPEGIAQALVPLLKDHDLRQQLGAAGRLRLETHFDGELLTRQLVDIWFEAIARHG
ncbi:MAG: glycosyltransferase family 4 protein [Proteobacteria bacterium]|jgi:glycosyltransferase involved in cell wall biosynthesis|nr:glycosyltransferase family 4 protein [Pseudomonadota bacterium]